MSNMNLQDKAPLGFVKGGTPTSRSEQMFEQRFRDAERRRDLDAAERRKIAVIRANPMIGAGGVFTSQLTSHPEIPKAYVPLIYVDRKGEPIVIGGEPVTCQADIIVGMYDRPNELALVLVCPRCMQLGQKHEQDCQITIRQSNRWFEFRPAMGPQTFMHQGKMYRSAGMIIGSEAFRCPDCDWRAIIDHNRVWPD